ncbi:MAG: histidine triad protein HinT [Metamycoplasmataceae bacterium]
MDKLFLNIINKKIKAKILFENKRVIAFYTIEPLQDGHFLVVPKKYSRNLITIKDKDLKYCFSIARKLALREIKRLNVDGFKIIVNNESSSGQEVYHTHIHVIPSARLKNTSKKDKN